MEPLLVFLYLESSGSKKALALTSPVNRGLTRPHEKSERKRTGVFNNPQAYRREDNLDLL
jgi:hypothetical protein